MSPLAGIRSFLSSQTEMSSAWNRPWNRPFQSFPELPSSLRARDHELRDYYSDQDTPATTIPYYTPYLGLRARLSQVWINRWTVLLLLIVCRLLIAIKDIDNDVARAKTEALSACTSVENVGSAMASMPHYLSRGVNSLAADGVTKAVNGLMEMLMLTVTGVEELVLFVINMMTSTYICLITLAISGSLQAAIKMIEEVGEFMNKSISSITGDLANDLTSFTSGLNGFLSDINIGGLFGSSKDPPQIDLTSQIDALNSIKIDPTALNGDLAKLNNSIPTFAQVQNFTNSMISLPFEKIKQLINESVAVYEFDQSVFPVPQKEALTFCRDNPAINDFFAGLVKIIHSTRTVFVVVLTLLAILVCVPMAYREIWRWRSMQQRSILLQKQMFDPMDVIYIASRPYTSTIGIKLSSTFKGTKRQILSRWFVAYATSVPALFVLSLGVAGLFSCLCQYVVLKTIQKEVPALASEVGEFADTVVFALNNASVAWAKSANSVINSTNAKVNDDVFGWVETSTSALNDTLNTFTREMTGALNDTFGGTILFEPIQGVFNCLIGLKVASFQKGLTWAHEHAHVTFPDFPLDVFSLGAAASITNSTSTESFLSSPGAVASDDITNAIVKVANKLEDGIATEAKISAGVIGVWVLVVFIGFISAVVAMFGRDKTRAEGGPVGYTGDYRAPVSPRSPNRKDAAKFPPFGGPLSSVYPVAGDDDASWSGAVTHEKMGRVKHGSVEASVKKGHERASSYGLVDMKR